MKEWKNKSVKTRHPTVVWLATLICLAGIRGACAQERAEVTPQAPGGIRDNRGADAGGYRIAGVVVDAATGVTIAGAELSIAEGIADVEVTADAEGRFAFAGLEPGKYAVEATAQGYVQERYEQHQGYSTAMAVGPGLDAEHMVFRLHRQAVVTGMVTDERGEVVRKAQVMLFADQHGAGKDAVQLLSQTETDDLGAYRFAHLQAGKYYVAVTAHPWYAQTAVAEGSATSEEEGAASRSNHFSRKSDPKLDVVYATTFYPGVTDDHSAGELQVSAGETQTADVRLQAVLSTHIRLTNAPVATADNGTSFAVGAMQPVFGSAMNMGLSLVAGPVAPGVYEVGGLPPGEVTLTLTENRNGQEWENRTIHTNVSDGESIDAAGTGAVANVQGRVLLAESGAVGPQGQVVLINKERQTVARRLQKDGTFTFQGVEAGRYEVSVNLGGGDEDYVERMTATGAKASSTELTIDEAGEVRLVIRMGRGWGQVKGVVKGGGKVEAGVMVLLVPSSEENLERDARMDQTDSDGTFTLGRILPGRYVLMAIEDGWELDWREAGALAPYREKGQVVEVRANEVKEVAVEAEAKKKAESGE